MKNLILVFLILLLITSPCMAFQLTPVLESNNEASLKEETQAHCDDVAQKAHLKAYSIEGTWYYHLFFLCRELRVYLSDLAGMALLSDMSKENYSESAYNQTKEYIQKYNDDFEKQITFLNELVTDNRFSSDFVVSAEKLKTLTREVIRYNNKIVEAIDSK